jgi:hypothetical protein
MRKMVDELEQEMPITAQEIEKIDGLRKLWNGHH